jgi:hypothetical protein
MAGFKQPRPIRKISQQGSEEERNVFLATVEIDGFCDQVSIEIIEKGIGRHPLHVGRNLLVGYRLIYDPTKCEYTLTKS